MSEKYTQNTLIYQWVLKYPYFLRNDYKIGYFSGNWGHFSPSVVKTVKKYPYATQFLSTHNESLF